MTLDVLLATCASSREADYKRPIGVFSNCIHLRDRLSWVGLLQTSPRQTCLQGPPSSSLLMRLFRIPLLLVSRKTLRFGLRQLLGLVLVSGAHVSTTIHWKGDSFPLGMAINLTSLLWASLHSSLTVFSIQSSFFAVYCTKVSSVPPLQLL